jgi:hypothetical protein
MGARKISELGFYFDLAAANGFLPRGRKFKYGRDR